MTTETTTKEQVLEVDMPGTRTPLAVVTNAPGRQAFDPPPMTDERKAFMKRQFCPPGCSDQDFEFFVAWCERTGLDPVLKQAYLVERKQKVTHPNGSKGWLVRFEPMAAVAGMAAKAESFSDFKGMKSAAVYDGDLCEIDFVNNTVKHTSNVAARKPTTKVLGAWAQIQRDGRTVAITYLAFDERAQYWKDDSGKNGGLTQFWAKMPAGQIQKCAEAEQYRKGYPNIFGGVFVPEEMPTEIEVNDAPAKADDPAEDTAAGIASRLRASRPGAESAPRVVDVVAEKPAAATVTLAVVKTPEDAAKAIAELKKPATIEEAVAQLTSPLRAGVDERGMKAKAASEPFALVGSVHVAGPDAEAWGFPLPKPQAPKDERPVMFFGGDGVKGKAIEEIDGVKLTELRALGATKLATLKDEAKRKAVTANLAQIDAELAKREKETLPPEPGSNG